MKQMMGWLGALGYALGVAGCSSDGGPSPADCLNVVPTVSTGIYGCVTQTNDVGTGGEVDPKVLPGFSVQVFQEQPPPTPDDGLLPLAVTKSDGLGFFELRLAPGSYWLCTSFRRCSAVAVVASTPLRANYDFGEGSGW
jgi:hypothetical protein